MYERSYHEDTNTSSKSIKYLYQVSLIFYGTTKDMLPQFIPIWNAQEKPLNQVFATYNYITYGLVSEYC